MKPRTGSWKCPCFKARSSPAGDTRMDQWPLSKEQAGCTGKAQLRGGNPASAAQLNPVPRGAVGCDPAGPFGVLSTYTHTAPWGQLSACPVALQTSVTLNNTNIEELAAGGPLFFWCHHHPASVLAVLSRTFSVHPNVVQCGSDHLIWTIPPLFHICLGVSWWAWRLCKPNMHNYKHTAMVYWLNHIEDGWG